MKQSKEWQNEECNKDLLIYQQSKRKYNQITYKKLVKVAKQVFFDNRIQEITLTNKRLWDLMNQLKKQKLCAIKAIKFNSHSYNFSIKF